MKLSPSKSVEKAKLTYFSSHSFFLPSPSLSCISLALLEFQGPVPAHVEEPSDGGLLRGLQVLGLGREGRGALEAGSWRSFRCTIEGQSSGHLKNIDHPGL